jgi:hypothetical protein
VALVEQAQRAASGRAGVALPAVAAALAQAEPAPVPAGQVRTQRQVGPCHGPAGRLAVIESSVHSGLQRSRVVPPLSTVAINSGAT